MNTSHNFIDWLGSELIDPSLTAGVAIDSLPDVLASGEVFVVFQPLVDLQQGGLFGHEALVRSTSPAFRCPEQLLAASLQSGCCGLLGRLIRQVAVQDCPDSALFLNIHPYELEEHWLLRSDEAMFKSKVPVFLELTETAPVHDLAAGRQVLRELRKRSISIALDDLGSGYSNLRNIAELVPDVVKLDRGLVSNLVGERRMRVLVEAIVRLCNALGARVVAEGVEAADEANALRDCGAHFGQGYYYGRPGPAPVPVEIRA
jgi:EAL domain-containing protein (putative c-di-GMP-specific phosphodiesterase class I)